MIAIFGMLLMFSFSCVVANTSHIETMNAEQSRLVATVKKTEKFIQENGIQKAIIMFRTSSNIAWQRQSYQGVQIFFNGCWPYITPYLAVSA